jgi:DNA-binding transcriptional LysR family regulator
MNEIELPQVDLNLLVVLDVLLREQSVTRTSARLHRTPSAISHALGRLRELLGDELLVRDGQRMRPTARALELAETLPPALAHIARVIAEPEPFDASTSTRMFRLAAPEFTAPLVPLLLSALADEAPSVRVEFAPMSADAFREVAEGRCDALLGPSRIENDDLRGAPVGSWSWRVFARKGHPAFEDWSLAAWASYPHVMVRTFRKGRGPIEQLADKLGVERTVGAVIPHFTMAGPILARTELLLTVPTFAMNHTAVTYDLDSREVPFAIPSMGLSLFRSATTGNEPGVRWFLERVAAVVHQLEDPLA